MQNEKISDIIAHFIGLFETTTEEARLHAAYAEDPHPVEDDPALPDLEASTPHFASDLPLLDYEPDAPYRPLAYDIGHVRARGVGRIAEEDIADARRPAEESRLPEDIPDRLPAIASKGIEIIHVRDQLVLSPEDENELAVFDGPGSTISHIAQVGVLQDDDYLNMTDGPLVSRETAFVTERLAEFAAKAEVFTPFSDLHRTDTYEGVQKITSDVQNYAKEIEDAGQTPLDTGATQDFVLAAKQIEGVYVDGELETEASPRIDDHMPDRGIAAPPPEEPEKSETPLEEHGPAGSDLDVAAGANVVTNIASVINTGVLAPVTAVMGDYHQVDTISQSYVYSDNDEIDDALESSGDSGAPETVAHNIALFHTDSYETEGAEPATAEDPVVFPMAWRVSVLEGDVSFVQWTEQYHFISDNDTMTVTSSGSETTVLAGGNAAVNFAAYFGMGMQYDLVIVGGDILDVNCIMQIALLYDNDRVRGDDLDGGADIQTGNNLIWNQASIHNIGSADRFEAMPDHIVQTRQAIDERDPLMPEGLSSDANFQGHTGLDVLYITGNLYDMTIIKQVAILGDSDDITQAASELLQNDPSASVAIDTGSNAVVNIAEIADYDSFGQTTYLAGQLYSDAILIQGGLLEDDTSRPEPAGERLANEVIAFLDDDGPDGDLADGMVNAGHDLSWSSAHPADVMQTVVA